MAIPKLLEAASNGTRQGGPDDDGSDESFVYGGPENADGPAVQTGAWLADVTYERAARPECTNNIKQIAIAIHALDAGECTVDICAQDSSPASPEPVTHTGWGPWEIVLGGPLKNTGYENPSSFQTNSAGADDMGRSFDLVFPTQTAFEQREGNAVATESLEIAHEGFLGGRDDGWIHLVKIDMTEPTASEPGSTDTDHKDWVMILKYDHADDGDLGLSAVDPNNPNVGRLGQAHVAISLGDGQTIEATDDGLLLPAVRMDDGEASIKDGTSNTFVFGERYGQTGSIGGISVACGDVNALGDPITFTYTVTSAGGAIAGVVIAATTDNNRTSDFDCSELTQWASHQSSSDTDIGGFIFSTETYKPTESLFYL